MLDRINPIKRQINVGIDENHIEPFDVVSGDLDGNKLELTIVQDEYTVLDLTGYTVDIVFKNIKNQTYSQDCTIKNAAGGVVTVTLAADVISVPGTIKAELRILEGTAIKTTTGFSFVVKKSLVDVETVVPKNQLPNYKSDLQNFKNETSTNLNNTKDELNTKIDTNSDRINNIVANTGNSNTEIVDARMDSVGKVYPTLGSHIRENDKRLTKIEIGKLSTVTSTDNVINLPNSSAGQLSFSLKGRTLYKRADGTYTDTWESDCTLENVGEFEDNKIEVLSRGKNLVDTKSKLKYVSTDFYDTIEFQVPSGDVYFKNNYATMAIRDAISNVQIDSIQPNGGKMNFTKSTKIFVRLNKTNFDTSLTLEDIQLMINKGAVPIPYEPYKQDKIDILTGNEPLRGLPNGVCDLVRENGDLEKKIGKRIFDGSDDENWILISTNSDCLIFEYRINDIALFPKGLCDKFAWQDTIALNLNIERCGGHSENHAIRISILKTRLETVDINGFKKWLQVNPITVYYQLAEPITEQLEQPLLLQSFANGSVVINSTIPPQITVNYPTSITTGIQTNANGIKALNDFIKQQNIINIRLDSRLTALEP